MISVQREKELGFSIIELLTVISIIALLAAIGVPNFNKYIQNTKLKDAARSLEGDIQLFKQRAIAESVNYAIFFDVINNRYIINTVPATTTTIRNLTVFGNITLANTGNINNATITLLSRGVTDTTTNQDTITLRNGLMSQAFIQTTSMGKVNVIYALK
jgi:prepilin-type N-terminal cleavage/methylation domain-containing protein